MRKINAAQLKRLVRHARPHIVDGEFQSDKYPTCPPGKVPLSVKDPTAQDLLWEYAQRRRKVDAAFGDDLEFALKRAGYQGPFRHNVRVRFKLPKKGRSNKIGIIRGFPRMGSKSAYVVWPDGWAGHVHLGELVVVDP